MGGGGRGALRSRTKREWSPSPTGSPPTAAWPGCLLYLPHPSLIQESTFCLPSLPGRKSDECRATAPAPQRSPVSAPHLQVALPAPLGLRLGSSWAPLGLRTTARWSEQLPSAAATFLLHSLPLAWLPPREEQAAAAAQEELSPCHWNPPLIFFSIIYLFGCQVFSDAVKNLFSAAFELLVAARGV